MFDIGFTELLLCLVVALVVIGPEQLPETVRTIGLWIGRLKRSLRETRSEIERQIGADDIRRQLHNEEIMRSLEQTRKSMENSILAAENNHSQDASPPTDEPNTSAAPSASDVTHPKRTYSPFEELPDHAHMNEPAPTEPPSNDSHSMLSTEEPSNTQSDNSESPSPKP